jgi:hypothetical protein
MDFTPWAAHVWRRHEADREAQATFEAAADIVMADSGFNPCKLIRLITPRCASAAAGI